MPYVTSIERLGRAEGMAEGLAEGRVEGRVEGAREVALRAIESGLRARFGDEGLALMPAIRQISEQARLEAILDKLWTATRPDDLPLHNA